MIHEGEPGEESLSGIQTADGFIKWRGSAANSQMQYFLRDHLGSVRVIASDRNNVISRSDYLPFGVRMTGSGLNDGSGRSSYFGFSGKENEMWDGLDAMSGNTPHWLRGERYQHFGARAYDPVTCIFMQIDPMAEKYYGLTPYGYCYDNPIIFYDFLGFEGKPTPAPENLLGTPQYYIWRQNDAFERGVFSSPYTHSYYIDFGFKYANKFMQVKRKLSKKGQKWVDDVMYDLQDALETILEENIDIESDLSALKQEAYKTHKDVYINNGVASLSFSDLVRIFSVLEAKDMGDNISKQQVSEVFSEIFKQAMSHKMKTFGQLYFFVKDPLNDFYSAYSMVNLVLIYYATGEEAQEAVRELQNQ